MNEIDYILMRYPTFIEIADSNSGHKSIFCKEKALDDYNNLLNILSSEDIKYYFLNTENSSSEVFIGDIGFMLDDTIFISNMRSASRKKETKKLIEFAKKNKMNHYIFENSIEGGDVVIGNSTIFVGISQRTTEAAIEELREYIEKKGLKYEVIPIKFDSDNKTHLNCIFNILDKKSALISKYVYDIEEIKKRIKKLYYIPNESADNLGANVLVIGKKKVICSNTDTTRILRKAGYKVLCCEYDEMIKLGGGIACSTLPIMM